MGKVELTRRDLLVASAAAALAPLSVPSIEAAKVSVLAPSASACSPWLSALLDLGGRTEDSHKRVGLGGDVTLKLMCRHGDPQDEGQVIAAIQEGVRSAMADICSEARSFAVCHDPKYRDQIAQIKPLAVRAVKREVASAVTFLQNLRPEMVASQGKFICVLDHDLKGLLGLQDKIDFDSDDLDILQASTKWEDFAWHQYDLYGRPNEPDEPPDPITKLSQSKIEERQSLRILTERDLLLFSRENEPLASALTLFPDSVTRIANLLSTDHGLREALLPASEYNEAAYCIVQIRNLLDSLVAHFAVDEYQCCLPPAGVQRLLIASCDTISRTIGEHAPHLLGCEKSVTVEVQETFFEDYREQLAAHDEGIGPNIQQQRLPSAETPLNLALSMRDCIALPLEPGRTTMPLVDEEHSRELPDDTVML